MWNPKIIDTDHVLYLAIADAIERDIDLGILKQGEKMPSQRALAKIIGVNLTTISRAYGEAEKRGLLSGTIGKGTYVKQSDHPNVILPDIIVGEDAFIDLGLTGSIKVEGLNIAKLFHEMAENQGLESFLDYVPCQGIWHHRQVAAQWMRQYGIETDPEHVMICAGSMHALTCSLLGLFDPGDKIAVETLTFAGFRNAATLNHMKLEPVGMDNEGMIPEQLENLCKRTLIKGIYLMPNMQNPTAAVMSKERKKAIAKIIEEYDLILIEDDIYNFTSSEDQSALSVWVPENGIFINGISKSLFPGLRISFVNVPDRYLYKFSQSITNTIWMASPICAELATNLLENGHAESIIDKKKQVIKHRLGIAKEWLKKYDVLSSETSPYLWLRLPQGLSGSEFENMAMIHRVRVLSAQKFYVGNQMPPDAIRISVGSVKNDDQLRQGLKIITALLENDSAFLPIM